MKLITKFRCAVCCLLGSMAASVLTLAQTPGVEERLAKAEAAVTNAQISGDNAWMLTSAAIVLMMTGPGLALFYGGLVRKRNAIATMMQSFVLMCLVTLICAIYGYSIDFC